ncbi:hypothetical protein D3C85_1617690 [compost metagenome]
MVMTLYAKASFLHQANHFTTDILLGVDWSYWNVTAFNWNFISKVAAFFFTACVPTSFFGINFEIGFVHTIFETNIIKDEEFGFWCEECSCTYTCRLQIFFCFLSDATWITVITFAFRCMDVAHNY